MPKILITILFIVPLILNCTQKDIDTVSERINGNKLELLVKDAIRGNAISNFELSGFLISYTPTGEKYNKLHIDSTITLSGIKLYSVILEFPNPVFNILAVYDENLNLYLQDNSLSGNIAVSWEIISEKNYLVSSENFIVKDRIEVSRLSLYSFVDSKISLVFRSFTRLKESGKIHEQNITFLNQDKIITRITSNNKTLDKSATFKYSTKDQKYVNKNDIFYNFILAEIKNANWKLEKPELSMETVEKIKLEFKRTNKNKDDYMMKGDQGYLKTFDSDRYTTFHIFVTEYPPKSLEGNLHINCKPGSNSKINTLHDGGEVVRLVQYQICHTTEEISNIQSSKLEILEKYFIQNYENPYTNSSYLPILESQKFSFDKSINIYGDLANTYFIES